MTDKRQHVKVSQRPNVEDDLPPPSPPPPPSLPRTMQEGLPIPGDQGQTFLPMPPPKETFSSFYQQRQKSELKRLFKHIHPDLRKTLDDVVDDELQEVLKAENAQAAAELGYQGEVQCMRWIFENWSMDHIGDPHGTKKLLEEETVQGGDVRGTSSMFEHQQFDVTQLSSPERRDLVTGDVQTATWLFETQSLDSLNKIHPDDGELVQAVLKEPVQAGDVKGTRQLFESKPLDALGRCSSVEDQRIFKLRSEIEEQKGDVKKTVKLFQAEPCCAIRDDAGNIHEIKSICREEIQGGNVKSARWLFETQPLDVINKDAHEVQIIRGISLEEAKTGGVDKKRWMFETQTLEAIHESIQEDKFQGTVNIVEAADVGSKRQMFETQPIAALKGETVVEESPKEEIVGGDVRTTLWLFETQPMETLKDNYEVGRLKKVTVTNEERGAVQSRKNTFETRALDSISKEVTEKETVQNVNEIERGDVKSYKQLFETIPISSISQSENLQAVKQKEVIAGNVKGNTVLFETTPLYAIKDCSGNIHEVTTVSREESIKGDVQNYKWMFETRPLDQFDDEHVKVEIIKGITRQEDETGDVKTAKWLFETQPLDYIHSKVNQTEQRSSLQKEVSAKGDVQTRTWLFETQPMDALHEKADTKTEMEAVPKANVKSHTWLFETQPLDTIKDSSEVHLKLCGTFQDDVTSNVDVKTARHLFETATLNGVVRKADADQDIRWTSKVHVQTGDVSRVKEIFETKCLDDIGTASVRVSEDKDTNIQTGSVHSFTWLFENNPFDTITDEDSNTKTGTVRDVEGGDVGNKKIIFETFSLDKIHDKDKIVQHSSVCVEKPETNTDVKSSTMLFESQPLYAIRDKDGQFHEVTTVKKEEVLSGDVRGARWQFETKPLDTIKPQEEVFVIRAVTQEDVVKGDVKSARWKFETQPLDSFASQDDTEVKTMEDIEKGNVEGKKNLFEGQGTTRQKYVRMVSVTDMQQGDVRTSTWLFENQPIDSLKGEFQEQPSVKKVRREESHKGDVKRCTWLFETQPLDTIKQVDPTESGVTQEEMIQADVRSTTWLFESTPLDKISFQHREDSETYAKSVRESLHRLCDFKVIRSHGIVIEANETRTNSVKMAKYQFVSGQGPKIQKEEVVQGNIKNIVLQLIHRTNLEHQITFLKEDEHGKSEITRMEVPISQNSSQNPGEDTKMADIAQVLERLLSQDVSLKNGIVMQEMESGRAEMTVYSLFSHKETRVESHETTKGTIQSTIGSLLSTAEDQTLHTSFQLEENEKGNVSLYRSCIEKGDLEYFRSLQTETSDEADSALQEQIEIVRGDVKEAKRSLNQQKEKVERSVMDIMPGDVKNVKKVFCSEGSDDQSYKQKEEIIRGDISSAKLSLGQAAKQPTVVEKDEIMSGDIKAAKESLELAKNQSMRVEREIIIPGKIYDLDVSSQEDSEIAASQPTVPKEEIISGDVKAAKQSLEQARKQSMGECRDLFIPGRIYDVNLVSLDEQSPKLTSCVTGKEETGKTQAKLTSAVPVQHGSDKATKQMFGERAVEANTVQHESTWTQPAVADGKAQYVIPGQQHQKQTVSQKSTSAQQARSLQKSVHVVEKKEITSASTMETRSQQSTSSHKKVSVSQEKQGIHEKYKAARSTDVNTVAGDAIPDISVANLFVGSEIEAQSSKEQTEAEFVVRGDVKAKIKSLQNATAEQRPVEKEEIVRGDMQGALQSLEKSSINVSKGDFKAAMIYRNAEQNYSKSRKRNMESEKAVGKQTVVVSIPPSDTELSPSVSVTFGEQMITTTANSAPIEDADTNNSKASSTLSTQPPTLPLLPPKICEKTPRKKPTIPPKPQCSNTVPVHPTGGKIPQRSQAVPQKIKDQQTELSAQPTQHVPPFHQEHESKECPFSRAARECCDKGANCKRSQGEAGCSKEDEAANKTSPWLHTGKQKQVRETSNMDDKSLNQVKNSVIITERGEADMEKQVPSKINAVEEIRACMQSYSGGESRAEINQGFKAALQNFGGTKKGVVVIEPVLPRNVIQDKVDNNVKKDAGYISGRQTQRTADESSQPLPIQQHSNAGPQQHRTSATNTTEVNEGHYDQTETKVVLREKKANKETEEQRRQRLSVHKDEIMKGNVRAAMEIFENLRKQEELKEILSKVEEIEGETSEVDVRSMRSLFENVPDWIAPGKDTVQHKPKREMRFERTESKDDADSISSVEVAFGDLERASAEIIHLKEQTLARLMDIEEAIKKALYSVSNLKSEADIAGLSGLFKESLGAENCSPAPNNIRKISIVSSKAKSEQTNEAHISRSKPASGGRGKSEVIHKLAVDLPSAKPRVSPQSSPSFISIQSAARKPADGPKCTPAPHKENSPSSSGKPEDSQPKANGSCDGHMNQNASFREPGNVLSSPLNTRRKVSILEVQTVPETAGIIGTKTVSEKYEETDRFGNTFVSSTTSTVVTKQAEMPASSGYNVWANRGRADVSVSPLPQPSSQNANERGRVFVTFSQPNTGKH